MILSLMFFISLVYVIIDVPPYIHLNVNPDDILNVLLYVTIDVIPDVIITVIIDAIPDAIPDINIDVLHILYTRFREKWFLELLF